MYSCNWFDPALAFKDTGKKSTSSNKTKELTKSTNMRIWEIDRLNRPFIRGSYTENKFSKKKKRKCSYWKMCILCNRFILYSSFYLS